MSRTFEKTDLYEDIKGAAIDNLKRNKEILKLPIIQAIAYYVHEMEGIFEDNELERILTLIPVGIFAAENNFSDIKIIDDVKYAIEEIESNKHDNLLHDGEKAQILKDIEAIKQYLNS